MCVDQMRCEGRCPECKETAQRAMARSRRKRERDADAFMSANVSVYPAKRGGDVLLIVEGRIFMVTGSLAKGLRSLAAGTIDENESD